MGMTIKEIIDGLQFTIDMFLFDPSTGEIQPKHLLNEDSRLTVDACEGAIDIMRKYQKLEQEPTTKNDLAVDCVARQDVERYIEGFINEYTPKEELEFINLELDGLKHLPSVTTQLSSELEKNSKKLEKNFGELDCISRADAIKAMQDKAKKITNEDTINGLCGAVAILFDMPSVTPQEPKTGHWVHGEYCSECGCDVPAYIVDWKWQKDMDAKYCPNCGAKMVEPQESEDKE